MFQDKFSDLLQKVSEHLQKFSETMREIML